MRIHLTILPDLLRELHRLLLDRPDGILAPAGIARGPDSLEFLLPGPRDPALAGGSVRAFRLPPGFGLCSHLYWHALPRPRGASLHLELGLSGDRGCSAAAFVDGQLLPVEEVVLAGPGMDRWTPAVRPTDLRGGVPEQGRHSRYIGALGGVHRHERLMRIRCLGIGVARLGSLLNLALNKAGCDTVLADPDVLEPHSEDAVECFPGSAPGSPKVCEVARFAAAAAPWARALPLPVAADAPEVFAAARACQLVFSAPDRDDARFAAALLSAALHRIHLDLGTGVFDGDGERDGGWRAGADVRLVLPGQGCLLCIGGLDLRRNPPGDWRRQRAGSLRSLNQLAAATAMLQFERLVAGDLRRSAWTRIEVAPDGGFTTRRMPVASVDDCPLCGRWAGAGDRAVMGAAGR